MKPAKELPPREVLQELFHYDPETGALTWKKANRRWIGKQAGKPQLQASNGKPAGYRVTLAMGRYYAHRIIFAMMGVDVPSGMVIDHRDGWAFNNRWANLRIASHRDNIRNSAKRRDVKIGPLLPKGVTYQRHTGKFVAQIGAGPGAKGHCRYIGGFDTPCQAHAAYCDAAKIHHGEFARSH